MKLSINTNISSVFALAFKDQSIEEKELNKFITEFKRLYERINSKESEENQKNIIADFLKDVYYKPNYEVNTKGRIDLAIHNGKSAKDTVGVIIEAKKPSNKAEMVTAEKPNVKAFQEVLLYYLDERIKAENLEIKNLIITNIHDWYIIDAQDFEKILTNELKKSYTTFKEGTLVKENNDIFYNEIAKNFFDKYTSDLPCTKVNLEIINKLVNSENEKDIEELTHYYKLLSPQHLLKLRFANDSNKLNNDFYNELLHIIGLKETADGGKKIIDRKPEKDRNDGSLIENTITILKNRNKLQNITNLEQFGETEEKQLFSVGLELCITWLNRILFLKLLEGQLIKYNNDDREAFSFLNSDKIKDYDELDELFFEVLAIKTEDRPKEITKKFGNIPYLNSSLFEQTELEQKVLEINGIKDRYELEIFNSTVLKDGDKRKTGTLSTLKYLFDFLDSYDFASDNKQKIQKERKTIINASVLGLIFEKINGYKDGSFYTPGFITEYMCRETIRKAVIQKFNDAKKWEHENWNDLQRAVVKLSVDEANKIINEVRICDPAVGSGHFLVSALNEMIAIKQDLQIFEHDKNGPFRGLTIKIENDELVTRLNGELFQYNYKDENSQRIQETLFKEKRTVIENCLFGVDINPKSVMICQLRLWIELLKNAYYIQDNSGKPINKELQTLPNIDINIKCGNSLVSRFKTNFKIDDFANIKLRTDFLKRYDIYQIAIHGYKQHQITKKEKDGYRQQIKQFKDYVGNLFLQDQKDYKDILKLESQLGVTALDFDFGTTDAASFNTRTQQQHEEIAKKKKEFSDKSTIYNNALEWRFEFPEVLSKEGEYVGFDVIIGNPPYGVSIKNHYRSILTNSLGKVPDFEIYYYFINQALSVLRSKGFNSYIIPNTILFNVYAKSYREDLFNYWKVKEILDCTDINIFEGSATVRCVITQFIKTISDDVISYRPTANITSFEDLISRDLSNTSKKILLANNQNWALVFKLKDDVLNLVSKIKKNIPLNTFFSISQGYIPYRQTDLVKIYGKEKAKSIVENREWHSTEKLNGEYKQEIWGANLSKYNYTKPDYFVWYGKHLAGYVDLKYFNQSRILIREITNPTIIACLVEEEFVNDPQIISIISETNKISLKSIWAIMNSKLATFYHFNSSPKATKGAFPKILVDDIRSFPLPSNIEEKQKEINILVDKAFATKSKGIDTNSIEKEIDDLVYKLYNLTPEEITIVEENTKK